MKRLQTRLIRNPLNRLATPSDQRSQPQRAAILGLLLLLLWSTLTGWGLAQAHPAPSAIATDLQPPRSDLRAPTFPLGDSGLDFVPPRLRTGQQLYQENCATCHFPVPVALLPSESWRFILQDASHYGSQIRPPQGPILQTIWQYVQTFSRPKSPREERLPYRLAESQYFKALHPQIPLPRPLNLGSCVTCHPGIPQGNFRQLSPEWDKAA